jgi:hypothetical protein
VCSDREDELRRETVATLARADNQGAWELLGRMGEADVARAV